jgi:hypothetical protein
LTRWQLDNAGCSPSKLYWDDALLLGALAGCLRCRRQLPNNIQPQARTCLANLEGLACAGKELLWRAIDSNHLLRPPEVGPICLDELQPLDLLWHALRPSSRLLKLGE